MKPKLKTELIFFVIFVCILGKLVFYYTEVWDPNLAGSVFPSLTHEGFVCF